ncbi:MAG: hypothetical protein CVU88_07280 [Firmicutes bacterium HGW-Firmicutes-13]|nr:MAG: hypothetical protein CVU88_07280 [Firmicutes bacterium HGW-Firmicutes-13]
MMALKRRKPFPASPLPKSMTRYRKINNSTSYTPSFFTRTNFQLQNQNNLIIVDDQDGTSSVQPGWDQY